MRKKRESTSQCVVCINNEGFPAVLELCKINRVVSDSGPRNHLNVRF